MQHPPQKSKSSILVLSKEKSVVNFGNKLRNRFQEVYICSEWKVAAETIDRNSANAKRSAIDAVIVDCDQTIALKLIDFVRKRPSDIKYSHLPLIAVVVMVSVENSNSAEFSFSDYRSAVDAVGGAHVYIDMATQNFQVSLDVINSVINRKNKIDVAYLDLKQNNNRAKKIPYFPVFGKVGHDVDEEAPTTIKHSDSDVGNNEAKVMDLSALSIVSEESLAPPISSEHSPSSRLKGLKKLYHDPKYRPKFIERSVAKRDTHTSSEKKRPADEHAEEIDVRDLMHHDRTPINVSELSIGGIHKDVASGYWRLSNNRWLIEDPKLKRPDTHEGGRSSKGLGDSSLRIRPSTSASNSPVKLTPVESPYQDSQANSPVRTKTELEESFSLESMSLSSNKKKLEKSVDPKRLLHKVIKETPLDLNIHNILDIDLTTRNISLAEFEILEHGWKNELEGDLTRCTFFYTKAAAFLRESHLPKLFLANLNFRGWKYFQALQFYNQAIHKLSMEIPGHYCKEDDFIAHYNRAVTKFRMGADDEGLLDLQYAVDLEPRNLTGLELLTIVQRRLGMYKECFATKATIDQVRRSIMLEQQAAGEEQKSKSPCSSPKPSKGVLPDLSPVATPNSPDPTSEIENGEEKTVKLYADSQLIRIAVPPVRGNLSMKERKLLHRGADGINPLEPGGGDSLTGFKVLNGMKNDIYTTIFMKPTPLQQALLCHPENRTTSQIDTIVDTIRLIPYFSTLAVPVATELAANVEYRVFTSTAELFQQNHESHFVCVILKGSLNLEQTNILDPTSIGKPVAELTAFSIYGHIDLLFQDRFSPYFEEVKKMVEEAEEPDTEDSKSLTREDSMSHSSTIQNLLAMNERVLSPNSFSSGYVSASSEVLLIPFDLYTRCVSSLASQELQQRIEVLTASGLFHNWLKSEIVRFARMGFMFNHNSGDVVLDQKCKPDYLYFVMSGILKAYKKPTLIEIIERKLAELRAKAERFDLKYSYHHKLRYHTRNPPNHLHHLSKNPTHEDDGCNTSASLSPVKELPPIPSSPARSPTGKVVKPDLDVIDEFWDSWVANYNAANKISTDESKAINMCRESRDIFSVPYDHTTISEKARQAIDVEIKSLEAKYQRALHELNDTHGHSNTHSSMDYLLDDEDRDLESNRCEIATLKWPMIFGEDCVLDCDNGVSRGSIVAETPCRIFAIHRDQLQTFKLGTNFSDRVAVRMVSYPEDDIVLEEIQRQKAWKSYRKNMMKSIPTTRWPKQNEEADPFVP